MIEVHRDCGKEHAITRDQSIQDTCYKYEYAYSSFTYIKTLTSFLCSRDFSLALIALIAGEEAGVCN